MKTAYLILNIEEYGKLISYCIEHDVTVFRSYWDDREKGDRCYCIDWMEKRLYYSPQRYWEEKGCEIILPDFRLDKYGKYKIVSSEVFDL